MIAVAIDTGGTKIAGAAINENGEILEKNHIDNVERTGPFILNSYFKIVDLFQAKYHIDTIGVGAGGRIDPLTGEVVYAVDLYREYIGIPLKTRLEEKYCKPVTVDNDCRLAVIGEKWLGAIRSYNNVFGLIIGTGIGGGLLLNGASVSGTKGGFGEIGHAILHPHGRHCLCGQFGCVEKYVSGTALWQRYNELKEKSQIQITSGYEFFSCVRQNDPAAQKVLCEFIEDLTLCAVTCANLYDPQALFFGGGILDTSDLWWDAFVKEYELQSNPHLQKIELIRTILGNNAPLLGAAYVAFEACGNPSDLMNCYD